MIAGGCRPDMRERVERCFAFAGLGVTFLAAS